MYQSQNYRELTIDKLVRMTQRSVKLIALRTGLLMHACPSSEPHPSVLSLPTSVYSFFLASKNQFTLKGVIEECGVYLAKPHPVAMIQTPSGVYLFTLRFPHFI